jgi:transposase InsO family protein
LAQVARPKKPGQVCQGDLTYIETGEGRLCLAFTLDSCSRRCVDHHARADKTLLLTLNTLDQALARSWPDPGLIHHSDRGVQYAAPAFQAVLCDRGITSSMSREANPYDNAMAESFVATLKTECFGGEIPPPREIAIKMIFDFIECFYNPHRRHSALGCVSPAQFEERLKASYSEGCSGGGHPGGESDSKSRSALAAGFLDNAKALANALSKPPETTRNHTLHPSPSHPPSTQIIIT